MGRSIWVSALLVLGGCFTGPIDRLAALGEARERWLANRPVAYQFVLRRSCFCGGPESVEIRVDGATITKIPAGNEPFPSEIAALYPDVSGLFDLIEREIFRPAWKLSVEYDPRYGYPISISADPIKNAIDDEFGYQLTGFRVDPS